MDVRLKEIESDYDQFLDMQDEAAVDEALRLGKLKCVYATTTTRSKNCKTGKVFLESQVYPVYRRTGKQKKKPSEKAQKNLNEKNARRRFIRLCNINFGPGDLWCTFSVDKDYYPESLEELKKYATSFIRKLQRIWKQEGIEGKLKYIYILEWEDGNKPVRPHIHMLMSGELDRDMVEAAWKYGKRNQTRRIYHDDDFMITGLANYLSKNPKGHKRWYASKGLKKPETRPRSFRKFTKTKVEKSVRDINKK